MFAILQSAPIVILKITTTYGKIISDIKCGVMRRILLLKLSYFRIIHRLSL